MSDPVQTGTSPLAPPKEKVDAGDLIPIFAFCCSFSSLYTEYPDCVGCSGQSVVCCIEADFLQCKLPKEGADPRLCCTCSKQNVICVNPVTCLKGQSQTFCIDSRCALPLDDDVPCLFTLIPFCVVMSFGECNVACFSKVKDLKNYPGNKDTNQA